MSTWEYRKIDLNEVPRKMDDLDLLNQAGEDGWELVGITPNSVAYLKRVVDDVLPAQEQKPAARTTSRKHSSTPSSNARDQARQSTAHR